MATTLRVQRAKRGLRRLRRFNAVFPEVYKRTPSDVRRLRFTPV